MHRAARNRRRLWCKQTGKAIDYVGFAPRKCAAPPETGGGLGASKPGKPLIALALHQENAPRRL